MNLKFIQTIKTLKNYLISKPFACLLFFLINFNLQSQGPIYHWAKAAGNGGNEIGKVIKTDSNGNVFIAGSFFSTTITFSTVTLTNQGNGDIYICKYDASGNLIWAKSFGSALADGINDIVINKSNEILITGHFLSNTIAFDNITLLNQGVTNSFICLLDNNGNTIWAKSFGGNLQTIANTLDIDRFSNIIIAGSYSDSTLTLGPSTLYNNGFFDIFIAKLDSLGQFIWAVSAGGLNMDEPNCITTDNASNIYVTGTFESDTISFQGNYVNNKGSGNLFTCKFNLNGVCLWAKSPNNNPINQVIGTGITLDKIGNVYVCGYFFGDSLKFNSSTLINNQYDAFLVKYDSTGNELFALDVGGNSFESFQSIFADTIGNIFVVGRSNSPIINIGSAALNNNGLSFLLCKYDSNGNSLWAINNSNSSNSFGTDITVDLLGNIYVIGEFNGQLNLGINTITSFPNSFTRDIFFMKLNNVSGIVKSKYLISLDVFPNPTIEELNIKIQQTETNAKIKIIDFNGKSVYDKNFTGSNLKLKVNHLKSGTYYIIITNDYGEIKTSKFIIQ